MSLLRAVCGVTEKWYKTLSSYSFLYWATRSLRSASLRSVTADDKLVLLTADGAYAASYGQHTVLEPSLLLHEVDRLVEALAGDAGHHISVPLHRTQLGTQ